MSRRKTRWEWLLRAQSQTMGLLFIYVNLFPSRSDHLQGAVIHALQMLATMRTWSPFLCGDRCIANLDFQGRLAWEIEFSSSAYLFRPNIIFCIWPRLSSGPFWLRVGMATPLCVEALPITILQQMRTISINLFLITMEDALRNTMLHVGKLCPLD